MEFRDKTFENERITIDGDTFTGCTIRNCVLVFAASQPFTFNSNTLSDSRVEFVGGAGATLQIMKNLYHGGFRDLVEQTFENIRQNR